MNDDFTRLLFLGLLIAQRNVSRVARRTTVNEVVWKGDPRHRAHLLTSVELRTFLEYSAPLEWEESLNA